MWLTSGKKLRKKIVGVHAAVSMAVPAALIQVFYICTTIISCPLLAVTENGVRFCDILELGFRFLFLIFVVAPIFDTP